MENILAFTRDIPINGQRIGERTGVFLVHIPVKQPSTVYLHIGNKLFKPVIPPVQPGYDGEYVVITVSGGILRVFGKAKNRREKKKTRIFPLPNLPTVPPFSLRN